MRNSGADAVVEGVGDHGCEYMTGGRVVVLGPTGRNFAAGMSGGIAYVLDEDGDVRARAATTSSSSSRRSRTSDAELVRALVEEHRERTGSPVAARVLDDWERAAAVRQGDAARLQARRSRRSPRERRSLPDDHPISSGGEGFVTAEVESGTRDALMGQLGGFLKLDRGRGPERDPRERVARLPRVRRRRFRAPRSREQGAAAWSAACRSATTAARSAT